MQPVLGWRHRKLSFGLHVAKLHILGFFSFCLDSFCANELHHTQHISVFDTIWCLVPKTLALKTLLDRGCCPKFLNLG